MSRYDSSSAISSGSLEQSLPTAAFRKGTKICSSSNILANPRALDARSRASWNNSFRDRLAELSSALSKNSLPLFCRPASRNSPVDLRSIPAIGTHQKSFPDWASPPRM
uniref:Uncharacterized protein n=1 Tax=Cynoglossus semilaevis TaxID=244447 RepID=A0A3P8V1L6_CYNSE